MNTICVVLRKKRLSQKLAKWGKFITKLSLLIGSSKDSYITYASYFTASDIMKYCVKSKLHKRLKLFLLLCLCVYYYRLYTTHTLLLHVLYAIHYDIFRVSLPIFRPSLNSTYYHCVFFSWKVLYSSLTVLILFSLIPMQRITVTFIFTIKII
jgi:hypothetical protein